MSVVCRLRSGHAAEGRVADQYAPEHMSYRCAHCGNRTRFDVVETVRRRSYHHFTLGGDLAIEEEEILSLEIESVTCRWCDRSDGIEEYSIGADRDGSSSSDG